MRKKIILNFFWFCGLLCGPITAGYIFSFSSPTLNELAIILTVSEISAFTSLIYIGEVVGSLIIGSILDKYGRRRSLILSILPAIISWLLLMWCGLYIHETSKVIKILMYTARLLGGLSCGMNLVCTPVYLVEVAPLKWRAAYTAATQLGITFGIMLCLIFGYFCSFFQLSLIAFIFSLFMLIASFTIPESPRWLYDKNYKVLAADNLKFLRDDNANIERELNDYLQPQNIGSKEFGELLSILKLFSRKYWKKSFLIIQLMFLQQFTGFNIFISYSDLVFFNSLRFYIFMNFMPSIIAVFLFIFTAVSMSILDMFGRKKYLFIGSLFMTISLITLSIFYQSDIGVLIMIALIVYIVAFSISWGPIPLILITEMLSQEVRASGCSLAILVSSIGKYFVLRTFAFFSTYLTYGQIFVLYALSTAYSLVFVAKWIPETKNEFLL